MTPFEALSLFLALLAIGAVYAAYHIGRYTMNTEWLTYDRLQESRIACLKRQLKKPKRDKKGRFA
jgi:hypothetical protein